MFGQLLWLLFLPLTLGYYDTPFLGPHCQCNKETAWMDVVIVLESTTVNMFSVLASEAESALGWFPIKTMDSPETNFTTRVGIVTYDDNAEIYAPLGTVTKDDLVNLIFGPKFKTITNGVTTNLAAGLKLAVEQFNSPGRRPNVPKIILLMSSFYNPAGVESPAQIAEDFKANGGIIINYKKASLYGDDSRVTERVASPGFAFDDSNGPTMDNGPLPSALCQANCFCPHGYSSYQTNVQGLPVAGCYSAVNTPATYEKAAEICRQQGGIVASGETASKLYYLNNLLSGHLAPPVYHRFFIGLTRDGPSGNWTWSDGTPLQRPYLWRCPNCEISPLISCTTGEIPTFDDWSPKGNWVPAECSLPYPFVCEVPPCDSVNYCPWQEIQQ